jgi:hypothetical protein
MAAVGMGGDAVPAAPADQALRILGDASRAYQGVRDYTCLFIKRERLRGQLQPDNLVEMKVRTQPFSVYLRWLAPKDIEGQQACYVAGRNAGQMRVHATGLAGVAGFVSLDLRDPRVMQNNRHTIDEAGIGNLIMRLGRRWEASRGANTTQFRLAEYVYNQRPCVRVETLHAQHASGGYDVYRTVVYFDKEHRLPVRVENYDWPRAGGDPAGDLLESYSYVNLRLNAGVPEATFNN